LGQSVTVLAVVLAREDGLFWLVYELTVLRSIRSVRYCLIHREVIRKDSLPSSSEAVLLFIVVAGWPRKLWTFPPHAMAQNLIQKQMARQIQAQMARYIAAAMKMGIMRHTK